MTKEDLFTGKIAIVTGAGSGIGRAVSIGLSRLGATVCAADINERSVKETVKLVTSAGGSAYAAKLDVTKAPAVKKLVEATAKRHGRLDYIFNNAGIGVLGEARDMTDAHWKKTIDVNLMGVLSGTLSAYRVMVKQGFGHIVNTASLAGLVPIPFVAPYVTTKHAVVGLSKSLRGEGAALGVKVSVVCPGFVKTPILENFTAVNFDRAALAGEVPKLLTNVDRAARVILSGVRKNKAIILVGPDAHIFWRLYKAWPGLVDLIGRRRMADVRAIKAER
jgi:NAD(P)-dependent dehydrogenase (short-subunit alcohol dehydrogenase family)